MKNITKIIVKNLMQYITRPTYISSKNHDNQTMRKYDHLLRAAKSSFVPLSQKLRIQRPLMWTASNTKQSE